MIWNGVSLARSLELTGQWKCILRADPVYPITQDDLQLVLTGGIGEFRRVAGDLHRRLSEFVHRVVVHRRDEAICGEVGYGRTLLWLWPDVVPPSPVLQCKPHVTSGSSGVLADPAKIDEEFREA